MAANAARDLQNAPANAMTPTALAERARALAGVQVDVWGRDQIVAAGMGALAAVAQGSDQEPQLITIRYDPPDVAGPVLGYVGKGVTFDSGGISIKPPLKMSEMKFDMSGAAAVLEATGAIAALGLPVRLVSVLGATENLINGRSMKPGDILRAKTGTTIEVLNTDAEGRLVLADCLAHAIDSGAERLVDLATLTGAIVTTFGNTYAGLFGSDDEWCAEVEAAGRRAGELVLAAAPARRVRRADQEPLRGHQQRGRGAQGRLDHRRAVPAPLHRRRAVGPPGHRRHRVRERQAVHAQGRRRVRRPHADRARPRERGRPRFALT